MALTPSMSRGDWERIKRVASQALARPPADRSQFAADACGGDEALFREVLSLLESMERVGERFETPALAMPAGRRAAAEAINTPRTLQEGGRIGAWKILRQLGHGGMGTVYLAERVSEEFHQRAAIKIVRSGMADEILLRRFHDERRILATLDHPHIARLIDGGATELGLPYVVMEYVEGQPIDRYCDENALAVRQRLEVFRLVCLAVHYAHQRLVVHRDLKATNILVTADGVPKLLDFGIAKILEAGHAVDETRTMFRVLTPESASPEQLRGEQITTSTDIYALGVLLYRLLTGKSPYRVSTSSETELIRAICEQMPSPPSVTARESAAARPRAAIDRDLDRIVMMALRKEPERRYGTAEQLAEDIRLYLAGRPVVAVPDSAAYRAQKFLRRHTAAVAVIAVALLSIVAAAGVAVYQARAARAARLRAEARFADVRRLANSFLFEFHDAIADLPGSLKARQLVVKRAMEYLADLERESQGDVDLQRELATANMRLGDILAGGGLPNLGDVKAAESPFRTALALRQAIATRPGASPSDVESLAELHVQLSRFLGNDLARAEEHAAEAVKLLISPLGSGSTDPHHVGHVGTAYQQLGYIQGRRGNSAAALVSLAAATTYALRQLEAAPADSRESARLARIEADYGEQLRLANRVDESIRVLEDARSRIEALVAAEPHNQRHQQNLVLVHTNESESFEAAGDRARSVDAARRAAAIALTLRAASPDDVGSQFAALGSHQALALALGRSGDAAGSVKAWTEVIAVAQSMERLNIQASFDIASQIAEARLGRGEMLLRVGRTAEGCRDVQAAGNPPAPLAARCAGAR